MIAALGRFISKLREKGLPFFKLLKMSDKFMWTDEADQALEELKTFLTTPTVMVPRRQKRTCCSTSPHPPRWSAQSWWRNNLKKVNPTPSTDLSSTLVRSSLIARSGTRNFRRCCTPFSSPRASSDTIYSPTRSRSCQASP
jgi:hypothetical protein